MQSTLHNTVPKLFDRNRNIVFSLHCIRIYSPRRKCRNVYL